MSRYKQPYTLIKRTLTSGKVIYYYPTPDNPVDEVELLAATGICSGEARALQWQDVSWDLKGLLILRAVKADGSIGQPKAKCKAGTYSLTVSGMAILRL